MQGESTSTQGACSNKQKFILRVSVIGQSSPSYNSKVVDYDQGNDEQGDQQEGGKLQAYEGKDGQMKAILKRRLFGSSFEGEGSVGRAGYAGGRSLYRGESSISKSLMRGARRSRVETNNSSENISDSNILKCNR